MGSAIAGMMTSTSSSLLAGVSAQVRCCLYISGDMAQNNFLRLACLAVKARYDIEVPDLNRRNSTRIIGGLMTLFSALLNHAERLC